ncbi:MAG TPA: hypothetical protein VIM89_08535 [Mucilaginibacter sp.]
MNKELQWEFNEAHIQLEGLGNYSESNAEILQSIYEDRFRSMASRSTDFDTNEYHVLSSSISELDSKIDLTLNGKSVKLKKESYIDSKKHLLFILNRLLR